MNKRFKEIVNNNSSGSNEILLSLISYCKKHYQNFNEIKLVCHISQEKLFHFATVKNFIIELKTQINHKNPEGLLNFLNNYELHQLYSVSKIYEYHKETLNNLKSITTISYSKTVLDIIKLIIQSRKKLKVFVLESRPILEGRNLAEELIKIKVDATILVDSLMSYALKNSEAVIIGADQILKNGNVVNKIGSYTLALCAKEFNKPFYVIADKSKFINSSKFIAKDYPKSEVWNTKKKIKIVNHYFEEVPTYLITKILSN